jgi:short chain dehydrogenase
MWHPLHTLDPRVPAEAPASDMTICQPCHYFRATPFSTCVAVCPAEQLQYCTYTSACTMIRLTPLVSFSLCFLLLNTCSSGSVSSCFLHLHHLSARRQSSAAARHERQLQLFLVLFLLLYSSRSFCFLVFCVRIWSLRTQTIEYTPEELQHVMNVNFNSCFAMMQLAHPLLKAAPGGASIVNIGSVAGVTSIKSGALSHVPLHKRISSQDNHQLSIR